MAVRGTESAVGIDDSGPTPNHLDLERHIDEPASPDRGLPEVADARRHRGVPMPRPVRAFQRMASARLIVAPLAGVSTIGRAVMMAISVVRYIVQDGISLRLPLAEIVHQAWSLYKVTALPALLMAVPFGGMVAVQSSGLLNQVGAASIVGAASGVGVVRQGAPLTAGLLMGGAAASAIASDLGARAIREELDALRVMGIDPVRNLVVPRFVALIIIVSRSSIRATGSPD